ncbi:phage tail assembly chaperone [Variovorax ginsengisoli]|uniref:Phage tail assembly chaperone n=1 Tax=Variovorax ginsengisoli TaxID=363844 RepID=A0ABT8SDQ3_9BURK|nr:phage tail assembly chaperone [Variovorax ginsengisoli]MDN8617874.1 phage tail assembly chaperone [Variovorax ginsengisoli]MDO1537044.1 phage tail assembly chaperone [Variovorax ginsengisoli]
MAKLKLNPEPTFNAKVEIHVPGKEPAEIEFTFKYRDKDELKAFAEAMKTMEDAEVILNLASAWDLTDPFNKESVEILVKKYYTASGATFTKYLSELTGAKEKN